ncbi:DUF350 domain-containing protein [Kingella negevensis]|uniref:Inner membrane protein YjfL n=1 Tax=Kingella negevensis TaxID=1522312 RepID=A0A238T923_9NEIS|nr:DUF350 domain-containing protein [Kingella negevensis]MDK4679957.1 DUF350 domain-containing protein [Kingella negevensis]MDK4682324.1 DUF350 domain-containing protein [Kingella negevensis]MDK4684578.1 DUF350 domain-containing protein [Kingella negevensis]MDK4688342.1 DUF350 domain-containing protein [Kingella negevensis]MDK4690521.1 DUF350 domain-containing protein [Kingella negevensis]
MSLPLAQYILYLQYMFIGSVMVIMHSVVYMKITPVNELKEIQNGNIACALSFGGTLIGFCLALASSITHSLDILNFIAWGIGAGIVQILTHFTTTRLIPQANQHLANNNIAVGILFAALSIAIGLINAACLS